MAGWTRFWPSYDLKPDSVQITLKIVSNDEQKRDSAQITLKIVRS